MWMWILLVAVLVLAALAAWGCEQREVEILRAERAEAERDVLLAMLPGLPGQDNPVTWPAGARLEFVVGASAGCGGEREVELMTPSGKSDSFKARAHTKALEALYRGRERGPGWDAITARELVDQVIGVLAEGYPSLEELVER
jgi:hypothetical protein